MTLYLGPPLLLRINRTSKAMAMPCTLARAGQHATRFIAGPSAKALSMPLLSLPAPNTLLQLVMTVFFAFSSSKLLS